MDHANATFLTAADLTLAALAFVSGSADIFAFLKFHDVFTSAMTGNTALLGLALGQGHILAAQRSLAAPVRLLLRQHRRHHRQRGRRPPQPRPPPPPADRRRGHLPRFGAGPLGHHPPPGLWPAALCHDPHRRLRHGPAKHRGAGNQHPRHQHRRRHQHPHFGDEPRSAAALRRSLRQGRADVSPFTPVVLRQSGMLGIYLAAPPSPACSPKPCPPSSPSGPRRRAPRPRHRQKLPATSRARASSDQMESSDRIKMLCFSM
ncbi:unnamed protein product [Acidocella sp. C78]|nr:unnamed protein product [Acidocella sp. C78]